jgi:NADPH:quinone reductase-like Zn-dependent oxidoreductase
VNQAYLFLSTGTGGVSMMALKLARAAGCKVIITSSSDEKLARIQEMDEVAPIFSTNYKKFPNWDEEVLRMNSGRGVDLVLENGGTPTILTSIKATARKGIVSQIGYLDKQNPAEMEGLLPILIEKAISLRYVRLGTLHILRTLNC